MLVRRHKIHDNAMRNKAVENAAPENHPSKDGEGQTSPYTKTDIMRMNKESLVELAEKQGIENAEIFNGTELKEMLIEKFQL